ncbi:NADH-quinone oxidoreductase subunit C [Sphingobacterium griseoflavum]|uniref:NADH-quinone oxidoreductase subunit C n=1 Tax=Sphingobacterium griseoflavum TaxID=1474952 RepID=A0ABQ3HSQ7_9SPHI|nr:NADH-quinone oxidoreductase subunit C [Sphingobacterium griseoflavum]GHE31012.1 NADH-quinone oxidoreductase subunit C [Sphingobacterium griseoflavum]
MVEQIQHLLHEKFGEMAVLRVDAQPLQPILVVNSELIVDICLFLRDTEGCYFDFLSNISAVDYFPEKRFAVVYHLSSIPYQTQVTLKVEIDNERLLHELPVMPSVSSVWRTADWHEREAYDLMGIFFSGHPDLRRILLPDDWDGYPLRKDYQDAETYHGIAIK